MYVRTVVIIVLLYNINITVVTVGFAVDSVRYNESSRNLKLKITRLQATANNFYLNILTGKCL